MMNPVIAQLVNDYRASHGGSEVVGSNERYYKGKGNLLQRLAIAFAQVYGKQDRNVRLMIYEELVGRPINSGKDLTVAEVHAIIKLLEAYENG